MQNMYETFSACIFLTECRLPPCPSKLIQSLARAYSLKGLHQFSWMIIPFLGSILKTLLTILVCISELKFCSDMSTWNSQAFVRSPTRRLQECGSSRVFCILVISLLQEPDLPHNSCQNQRGRYKKRTEK